ncbi:restriction endonuclease [Patescibacteria group bacterium]|nr:restriction endonuclease [Patescibacteria group bacterium]
MPTPTPIPNYGLVAVSLILQGFMGSIPNLFNLFISFWWLWWILLFLAAVRLSSAMYQQYILSKAGMFEIDKMTGEQFEERLQVMFTNLGYKAERTSPDKTKPDYGVDLVVEKDGRRIAVQAKCYRKQSVGEDAVREALAGKDFYHCQEARVITNNNYSRMALKLARACNVELWNRKYLTKVLLTEKSRLNNLTS